MSLDIQHNVDYAVAQQISVLKARVSLDIQHSTDYTVVQQISIRGMCQAKVGKDFTTQKKQKKGYLIECPAGGIPSEINHFTGNDLFLMVNE